MKYVAVDLLLKKLYENRHITYFLVKFYISKTKVVKGMSKVITELRINLRLVNYPHHRNLCTSLLRQASIYHPFNHHHKQQNKKDENNEQ